MSSLDGLSDEANHTFSVVATNKPVDSSTFGVDVRVTVNKNAHTERVYVYSLLLFTAEPRTSRRDMCCAVAAGSVNKPEDFATFHVRSTGKIRYHSLLEVFE